MTARDPLRTFVNRLGRRPHSAEVFNPYRQKRLRENLYHSLSALQTLGRPPVMLVGEALGFKGGKLTGLPFSSARLLRDPPPHPFLQQLAPQLDIRHDDTENTAQMVWAYLTQANVTPLCWNAFPFHPHPIDNPSGNRAPRKPEITEGITHLRALHDLFEPYHIVGVGRAGTLCAQTAFPNHPVTRVRHPSYGGKSEFVAGMDRVLGRADG